MVKLDIELAFARIKQAECSIRELERVCSRGEAKYAGGLKDNAIEWLEMAKEAVSRVECGQ